MAAARKRTFAAQLEAIRGKAGLSQVQAAAACKVVVMTWLRYSRGEREPAPDRQAEMLAALGAAARAAKKKPKPGPSFADELQAILDREGITQAELAREAGRTERTVQRWLAGGTRPADAAAVLARLRGRFPG